MKKTIAITLALILILALAGCGVTTRNYRRYSYTPPATDYNTGHYDTSADYNTTHTPRTQNRVRTNYGRSFAGDMAVEGRPGNDTILANPGDSVLYGADGVSVPSPNVRHMGKTRTPAAPDTKNTTQQNTTRNLQTAS